MSILMKKPILVLAVAVVMLGFVPCVAAAATVLTFDSLPAPTLHGSEYWEYIPDGYGGLDWSTDFRYYNTTTWYNPSGYANGVVSGAQAAFNAYASTVWATNGVFDFNSAYLTAAWNDNLNITVEGWLGASLVYTQTVVAQVTATLFAFDYLGIDRVEFNSFGGTNHGFGWSGTHFAMDDMTITSVIPVPGALLLGAIGACFGVLGARRKSA